MEEKEAFLGRWTIYVSGKNPKSKCNFKKTLIRLDNFWQFCNFSSNCFQPQKVSLTCIKTRPKQSVPNAWSYIGKKHEEMEQDGNKREEMERNGKILKEMERNWMKLKKVTELGRNGEKKWWKNWKRLKEMKRSKTNRKEMKKKKI